MQQRTVRHHHYQSASTSGSYQCGSSLASASSTTSLTPCAVPRLYSKATVSRGREITVRIPCLVGVCLSSRTHIFTTGTARLTNARTVRSRKGPGYLERKFHGTNGPGNECSRERMVLGTNIPDTVYMDYCLVIFFYYNFLLLHFGVI